MILADDVAEIYARVLIAIARGDGEITPEEGAVLDRVITQHASGSLSLAELMFAPTLRPEQLAAIVGSWGDGGPFRTTAIDLGELARMLVDDALEVLLAKGSVSSGEEASLVRFATALGIASADVHAAVARASIRR